MPSIRCGAAVVVKREKGERMEFVRGDSVWVRGRAGTFQGVYRHRETALVRYQGEQGARVVRLERIALSEAESLRRALSPVPVPG
jgi:hypothetical protein